jgi:hypothetical protein
MNDFISIKKQKAYDIVVIGGGIAGISAAVSSARLGNSVLLIEKQINLGGLATTGLISWYEPLCDGSGKQMIGGIAEELIRLAVICGFDNLPSNWGGKSKNKPRNDRFSTYYSPTFFSLELDNFVLESGAELLFDTYATYPVMDGNVCRGIITENADGRSFYPAKVVIDCTGDASIFTRAGAPTESANNYLTYIVHETDYENTVAYTRSKDLCKLRRWKNCGSDYMGNGHPKGIPPLTGCTAKEINDYVILGKKTMLQKYQGTDPDSREILSLPTMPQFRVIRRIIGEYTFTGEENGKEFYDNIGSVGDFRYRNKQYQVPYRCLYNKEYPNLLSAGRIVSAVGDGMEVLRVIPCCAVTGQGAGAAASIAVDTNRAVSEIDVALLQKHLRKNQYV